VDAARSWIDRGLSARDRLLASPRFQRWAAGFPLTGWIARRRARALFDLCAGFVYSQVLYACVRLGVLEQLRDTPHTVAALAPRLALSHEATARLLAAAASLRLVERRPGRRYAIGPLGAALVGNPGIAAMVEHHALLYGDLRDPVALLRAERRNTALARYWPYAGAAQPDALTADQVAPYTALMSASQGLIAAEIVDAYRLGRHAHLLDVGGGDGSFLLAAAAAAPALRVTLFDLPAVAERARARFVAAGLGARAAAVGGDFRRDALPAGADLASLVRVLHDHDDATVIALLRAVRRVLPPDGTLLVAEPLAGTPGAEPVGDAYFGFYLLAMGWGRARTQAELGALLVAAGFAPPRAVPTRTPLLTGLLVARPAADDVKTT
jgi:demethylspheroidene O-methyltransferase